MSKVRITLFISITILCFTLSACAPAVSVEAAPASAEAEPTPDRIQVFWFIGLGGGSQPEQALLQKQFAQKYNESQSEIQLLPIIVDNTYASDNLIAQMEEGNPIDIVGPMGTSGRSAFPDTFLDLQPLIDSTGYDLGDIDPAFLEFYKDEGKVVGLPFAIFPEALYYNRQLFDAAGLAYPPQKYGAHYQWPDGTEEVWNFGTMTKLARELTLDASGNNATSISFDANAIVQYGYVPQWTSDNPRALGTLFGASLPIDYAGNATLSEEWRAAWSWYHDGIFGEQPFIPGYEAMEGELLGDNPFSSGQVAMATTHLWYTCCVDPAVVPSWDVAAMPSYNDVVTSKMHGDTFAIMKNSKNPEAAFKVYTYMLGEGSEELYAIYGGLPARESQQADFFANLDEKFAPNQVNWQVFLDSIQYMDIPNHELYVPNYSQTVEAFQIFGSELKNVLDLNVEERINELVSELNRIYKASEE
jgi:multiple sugar transport system substrate-binding protein